MTTERSLHNATPLFGLSRPQPPPIPHAALGSGDQLLAARKEELLRTDWLYAESETAKGVGLVCTCPENTPPNVAPPPKPLVECGTYAKFDNAQVARDVEAFTYRDKHVARGRAFDREGGPSQEDQRR